MLSLKFEVIQLPALTKLALELVSLVTGQSTQERVSEWDGFLSDKNPRKGAAGDERFSYRLI
jgi:hypothetical protein